MINNFEILPFDYILISLSFIFTIFSFWKGFINSLLGLLTWVGSIFITIFSYLYLSDYISSVLLNIRIFSNYEQLTNILSIIISIPILFLFSLFILKKLRRFLSSDLDKQILGLVIDKFFGIIYGIIFSYIFFTAILYFTNNNDIQLLNSFYNFLVNQSNILEKINTINTNILNGYSASEDL